MKKIIMILIIFFIPIVNLAKSFDYKYCDKIKLIDQIINFPDSMQYFIKQSNFNDKDNYLHLIKFRRYDIEVKDYLKLFKGKCVLTYNSEEFIDTDHNILIKADVFVLNYLGKDANRIIDRSVAFEFIFKNDKWIIDNIDLGNRYNITSLKSNSISTNFKDDSISGISESKNDYYNKDYNLCGKVEFLNKILGNTNDFQNTIINSSFYDLKIKINDTDFSKSMNVLKEYFNNNKDSCNIWLNYPFPIDDEFNEQYLNQNFLKDYFIIRYKGNDLQKAIDGCITIEFLRINSKWYINQVMNGIPVQIETTVDDF
ncbi:MAG: hypothetical protein A2X61_13865 [Ignavibacteria bacterium GWB2_35_12]|nr:MAG: hypothetical protein A2X63_04015 [Ignavibacteria bacterium GWA2_35_8]OGU41197.1 MAG: hypothetical protein A2X61_13865 [Ignavibacteria bacterium GWB2_35_12]OGU86796.1 MAG: hypothetical protein A2220_09005 [Ignavibacteria bacterium RIFOXYA2_FULL_35_10]OGV23120.1 MAG: hypothetical protein A2475_17195 [Ignavibacteria bacterium RIFOXYC2_FULL_35_21]